METRLPETAVLIHFSFTLRTAFLQTSAFHNRRTAPQQAGLEPLKGPSPEDVGRSHLCRVCTGRWLVSQACTWGGITVAECLHACACVYTVHMCCPRTHGRNKHVRKSMAGENSRRESEEDWGLYGSSVHCSSLTRISPQASLTGFQWRCSAEESGLCP